MLKISKISILALLLILIIIFSGCHMRSPILLYQLDRSSNPPKIPNKIGLEKVQFDPGPSFVSKIKTYWLPIPFYIFSAKYPKLEEKTYIDGAIYQYFKDNNTFSYIYMAPFDSKDVNYILSFNVRKCKAQNNIVYSSLLTLPFVNFLVIILPQQIFISEYDLEMEVKKPNGEVIGKFWHLRPSKWSYVWIYQQPLADYIWYHSVFKKQFLAIMGEFNNDLENLLIKK